MDKQACQNKAAVLSLRRHDVTYFCPNWVCLGLTLINSNLQCTISQRKGTIRSKYGESTSSYQPCPHLRAPTTWWCLYHRECPAPPAWILLQWCRIRWGRWTRRFSRYCIHLPFAPHYRASHQVRHYQCFSSWKPWSFKFKVVPFWISTR